MPNKIDKTAEPELEKAIQEKRMERRKRGKLPTSKKCPGCNGPLYRSASAYIGFGDKGGYEGPACVCRGECGTVYVEEVA